MTASTLLIDCPGVWSAAAAQQPAHAWLQRLASSGVALWALRGDAAGAVPPGCPAPALFADALPALGPAMAVLHQRGVSLASSWLISADAAAARLASALGCTGVVLLEGTSPPDGLACTLAWARDLADAPRVMIPAQGGCWHDHRMS